MVQDIALFATNPMPSADAARDALVHAAMERRLGDLERMAHTQSCTLNDLRNLTARLEGDNHARQETAFNASKWEEGR